MNAREDSFSARGPYRGPTYYGEPALKASSWDALVWSYMYLAGLAGSAQVLATIASTIGRADLEGLVRQGRSLAALLPLIGAGMLVADLHTPQRWFNMVRIFRQTSPMSIGTYLLGSFTMASLATAWGERRGHRTLARTAQVPAAIAGAGLSVYTAPLLAATSTPLWSAAPSLLGGQFAASSLATAAAALSLGETARGHARNAANLDRTAALAALVEFGLGKAAQRRYRELGVDAALHEPGIAATRHASSLCGVLLPIACLVANEFAPRRSRALSLAGAVAVLAGGLLMRKAVLRAGNRSARRPENAFALAAARPADGRER